MKYSIRRAMLAVTFFATLGITLAPGWWAQAQGGATSYKITELATLVLLR